MVSRSGSGLIKYKKKHRNKVVLIEYKEKRTPFDYKHMNNFKYDDFTCKLIKHWHNQFCCSSKNIVPTFQLQNGKVIGSNGKVTLTHFWTIHQMGLQSCRSISNIQMRPIQGPASIEFLFHGLDLGILLPLVQETFIPISKFLIRFRCNQNQYSQRFKSLSILVKSYVEY